MSENLMKIHIKKHEKDDEMGARESATYVMDTLREKPRAKRKHDKKGEESSDKPEPGRFVVTQGMTSQSETEEEQYPPSDDKRADRAGRNSGRVKRWIERTTTGETEEQWEDLRDIQKHWPEDTSLTGHSRMATRRRSDRNVVGEELQEGVDDGDSRDKTYQPETGSSTEDEDDDTI